MALSLKLPAYDSKAAEIKKLNREKELSECETLDQKIALRQVWALEDIKINHNYDSRSSNDNVLYGGMGFIIGSLLN